VTYTLAGLSQDRPSTITLLENRSLISAAGTTGRRTWEAALHLGQYLCANPSEVSKKRVLELGAGTGYLSVLCAKWLVAADVIASDGSGEVVEALPDTFFINNLQHDGRVRAIQLKWGHTLSGNDDLGWSEGYTVDVLIGADVTYDESIIPPLVGTIQELFEIAKDAKVLIAATERNKQTFEFFVAACSRARLDVEQVDFPVPLRREQLGPFYSDSVPIHICSIKAKTS
jgi:protein-lysine N-methyltransferase EEF2KMT